MDLFERRQTQKAVSRGMVSGIFIMGGMGALMAPAAHAQAAKGVLPEGLATQGARLNGALMVGAGALFAAGALGKWPAYALAASLVPVTVVGHRFWEKEGQERRGELIQVVKNLALLGAVLYVAGEK
ncbi:DoxX family protein [Deinococcus altitudinis]|uniref:DoxX family protein n=1 Tax=Deinococcus altitudinis TaxID=468914 RepID=UPI0038921F34